MTTIELNLFMTEPFHPCQSHRTEDSNRLVEKLSDNLKPRGTVPPTFTSETSV